MPPNLCDVILVSPRIRIFCALTRRRRFQRAENALLASRNYKTVFRATTVYSGTVRRRGGGGFIRHALRLRLVGGSDPVRSVTCAVW